MGVEDAGLDFEYVGGEKHNALTPKHLLFPYIRPPNTELID